MEPLDYEYATQDADQSASPWTELEGFEEFSRRELPSRVRRELEVRIEEVLDPIEEGLRGQIVDIVRDVLLELLEMYKSTRSATNTVLMSETVPQDGALEDEAAAAPSTSYAQQHPEVMMTMNPPDLSDVLHAYEVPPYLDDFAGFHGELFDFLEWQPNSINHDSGYDGSLVPEQDKGQSEVEKG